MDYLISGNLVHVEGGGHVNGWKVEGNIRAEFARGEICIKCPGGVR